jgi:phage/plasmid-like protein (TIGR03299 family)
MTQVLVDNRRNAWNKGGTSVDATSAIDVAKQAGLDWTVSLTDLYAEKTIDVSAYDTITKKLIVPRKQAVIKHGHDGDTAIGVVGNRYKVVQNMEVFSALDTLIESGEARYNAAGEYNDGANVWMLMELPTGVSVAGDPHAAFLLAKTSHDGSCSVIIRPIIERIFCANQIGKIINGKYGKPLMYKMKHTTNSELSASDIRAITTITYKAIEEYELTASDLLRRKVDKEKAMRIFRGVWSLPPEVEDTPQQFLSRGQQRQQTIAWAARDKAWHIYSQSPTQENIRGTAFGVWQAVIEYADYYASGGETNRTLATITGRNDAIKNKALAAVLSA